jgi:hypothetical protein
MPQRVRSEGLLEERVWAREWVCVNRLIRKALKLV